jgi:hypothetical protein
MTQIVLLVENEDAANRMAQHVEKAWPRIWDITQRSVDAHYAEILGPFRIQPPPVSYPFVWTSVRQRAAFFATNGFGRGIPTRRTGLMVAGWGLLPVYTEMLIQVTALNRSGHEQYVTGIDQQPGHRVTGWYNSQSTAGQQGQWYAPVLAQDIVDGFWKGEGA